MHFLFQFDLLFIFYTSISPTCVNDTHAHCRTCVCMCMLPEHDNWIPSFTLFFSHSSLLLFDFHISLLFFKLNLLCLLFYLACACGSMIFWNWGMCLHPLFCFVLCACVLCVTFLCLSLFLFYFSHGNLSLLFFIIE